MSRRRKDFYKQREAGFDLSSLSTAKLPEYNGLLDRNLRHYYENRRVQRQLQTAGLITSDGHVIDLSRHAGKVAIIEQEFKNAEREEERRRREEQEMRERVQKKRHEALELAKHKERMRRMKADRAIRSEIVRVAKGEVGLSESPLAGSLRSTGRPRVKGGRGGRAGSGRGIGSGRKSTDHFGGSTGDLGSAFGSGSLEGFT